MLHQGLYMHMYYTLSIILTHTVILKQQTINNKRLSLDIQTPRTLSTALQSTPSSGRMPSLSQRSTTAPEYHPCHNADLEGGTYLVDNTEKAYVQLINKVPGNTSRPFVIKTLRAMYLAIEHVRFRHTTSLIIIIHGVDNLPWSSKPCVSS